MVISEVGKIPRTGHTVEQVPELWFTPVLTLARQSQECTQEFDLAASTAPLSLRLLAREVTESLGQAVNTAILKRYSRDSYVSGAYRPHPEESGRFAGRMAIVSLSGQALFYTQRCGHDVQVADCHAGTVVILEADTAHWVSPPLGESSIREIAFFGHDTTKEPEAL